MKRLLRWIGGILGSLAVLALVAYAIVYVLSERIRHRTYPFSAVAISIPTDPASITEGQRLATIHGCFNGCHGKQIGGMTLLDDPMIGRVIGPDLTAATRKFGDAQLAAVIRTGVRPDGRSMLVMPSQAFNMLTDDDLGRIIAYLKSSPPAAGLAPGITLGPIGRIGLVGGIFKTSAQFVAEITPPPDTTNDEAAQGRYLARTTCAQCHGSNLGGASHPEGTAPPLQVVAAYSPEAFTQLMRIGKALGGRELGTMSQWARDNLSHLTDAEIAALYSYLHAMPAAANKSTLR